MAWKNNPESLRSLDRLKSSCCKESVVVKEKDQTNLRIRYVCSRCDKSFFIDSSNDTDSFAFNG